MSTVIRIFVAALVANLCVSSYAQTPDINWGSLISTSEKVIDILGENGDGVYTLSLKGKEYFLSRFDSETLSRKSVKKLAVREEEGLKANISDVLILEENIIMFTYSIDKKSKQIHLYGYLLDKDGRIKGKRKDIYSLELENRDRLGSFFISVSEDQSKLLVGSSLYLFKKEGGFRLVASLLSSSLEPIKQVQQVIPAMKYRYVFISDQHVQNDGSFFLSILEQKISMTNGLTSSIMRIVSCVPSNGFELNIQEVKIEDRLASQVMLTSDSKGNLIGAGFYSEPTTVGMAKGRPGLAGLFYVKINPTTRQVVLSNTQKIPVEFTATVIRPESAKNGTLISNQYVPREMYVKENGKVVLVAEYYERIPPTSGQIGSTYIHGPVGIFGLTGGGELEWASSIPKKQVYPGGGRFLGPGMHLLARSSDLTSHSILYGTGEGQVSVMFNGPTSAISATSSRELTMERRNDKQVPILAVIDSKGNVDKSSIDGTEKIRLKPLVFCQVDERESLIYGTTEKGGKIGRIKF
ncbi:MAG: hypothetical protein AAGI38_06130 [Bacteroidota bacterium]